MGTQEKQGPRQTFLEEVINRGNLSVIDELSDAKFVDHQAPPGVPPTPDGL